MTDKINDWRGNISPKEIVEKILSSKEIVLTTHVNPDGDAMGSILALLLMIDEYNKKYIEKLSELITVRIVVDDNLPKYMEKFRENILIEKFENFSIKGEADLFISVDCANEERYGRAVEIKKNCRHSINIDHHISNTEHAEFNYVENVSSTSELLYKFLPLFKIEMTKEIAEYMYLGIINDTGNFRNDNVTEDTFEVCAKLSKAGADNHKIANIIFSMSMKKVNLFGDVYKNKVINEEYGFIYYYISQQKMKEFQVEKDDTDGIAELMLKIENMEIALFIREEENGTLKGSLRCNEKYDVNGIASEFNGGGHIKAAGFKTELPLDEILEIIFKKISNSQ